MIYVKDSEEDKFEKIQLSAKILDFLIYDGEICCILHKDLKQTYLAKSADDGKTFENLLEIDNLRKVCIYDNSIYLITNTSGFSSNLKHTIYRYNVTLEKILELDKNFAINKFHIFERNIFLIGSDVFVVKNSDWIYNSFEYFSGSNYDVFPYENKVIVSKGNYLYNRQLDLTTKVREPSIDKVNDIRIHPKPATDYIYINLTAANQVEEANH